LVIDKLSIHPGLNWHGKKWYGFVDMGTDFVYNNENTLEEKNALVFLAVGLNGYWKVPSGCFLISSLNEKTF